MGPVVTDPPSRPEPADKTPFTRRCERYRVAETGPYADLHVHTTRSDGSLEPAAVPDAARVAGLSVVAITDHDTVAPFSGTRTDRTGGHPIIVVSGIELRVETESGARIDLLGYGVDHTDALLAALERIQANRQERGQAMVDRVEAHLGIDLDVEPGRGFGRPHLARAIDANPATDFEYGDAFDDLIGDGGPCYVPREIPSVDRGRRLLAEACDLVALAHPLRYPDPADALALAGDVDAIERAYPYDGPVDLSPVDRAIEAYGLAVTGGSDAHDGHLGAAGLNRADWESLSIGE